jgi:predicted ATPase
MKRRHQTLEAMLDWSYALLSEAEQNMLGRLSVFAGGWILDAAEVVCANIAGDARVIHAPTPDGSGGNVLDVLSHLVDKSMVSMDRPGSEVRYHLLETIR